ncbi:carbohydrate-selective porin [Xenococcus sp. PCC 7305]|uniref:iron uptake porin n=1 Tax=Xenococcus sp. PCC 7305 TaxID=102125 RepID=UPI0002AC2DF1|nr:iron uptake porin [Xenococcus sp. PCC 7305]ELS04376.1 carbohydrate-selective porin [Xenococcus sp. PCC 7305]
MSKLLRNILIGAPVIAGIAMGSSVQAQTDNSQMLNQLRSYSSEGGVSSVNQVTNVNQLRDVSPADWAYEALRSLVDRYGCIVGYPDQTYRGNQALSRYEFAAGLNACLNQIERLIASSEAVIREDIEKINRLLQEFEAELATLGGRVDSLEGRVAFLEDHQFSTTTKLQGEVVFGLAQEFNYDNQAVFQDRVRLAFVSSFTGKDSLYTRLDAGNARTFNDIDTGAFTYSFDNGNNVEIGWLAYYFPIGDNIDVYLPAAFPLWQDFVPTVSPYLDSFTGATASLSSFGESSPIYKIGLAAGGGVGANVSLLDDKVVLSGGYFGDQSFDPSQGNGLFNGDFSALGQLTFNATDDIQLAATYVRGYFQNGSGIFDLGVGTSSASNPLNDATITTDSVGLQGSWTLMDSKVAVNAFGLWTQANATSNPQDAEIWSYGLGLAFPDLGKEGNLGGLIAGVEPYAEDEDNPIHVEGFYKYQLNDNISVTPGLIYIIAPSGSSDDDDAVIGVVRTTFTF